MFGPQVPRRQILIVCLLLGLAGCSATPAEHVRSGDAYFKKGSYLEAIVEYRASLQKEPLQGEVYLKLGEAYFKVDDRKNALMSFIRAADLLPRDLMAQLRAGGMLAAGRRFEDAQARADKALDIDPKNVEALILLGNAMVGLKDFSGAESQYQEALGLDARQEAAIANLGVVQLLRGQKAEAEASFREAVDMAPASVRARVALANYLWGSLRLAEAEQELKKAVSLAPGDSLATSAIGTFYLATNRAAEAGPYFERLSKTAKSAEALLSLADYYVAVKRFDDARKVLRDVGAKHEDAFASAMTRLAALEASQGSRAQALLALRDVLNKAPRYLPARLLEPAVLLAHGQAEQALTQAKQVIDDFPDSDEIGPAYTVIGRVQTMLDRPEDAIAAFEQVLKRDTQNVGACLSLGALHLGLGTVDRASTYTHQAIALQPRNLHARVLLIQVLNAEQKPTLAKEELNTLKRDYPNAPFVLNLVAAQQIRDRQYDAGRTTLLRTIEIAPQDLDATTGLVKLDLMRGRAKDAVGRVETLLKAGTPSADALILAGRTYAHVGDVINAEGTLRRAIEADPGRLQAYGLLGELYIRTKRLAEAKLEFEEMQERDPKSIPAGTMLGLLWQTEKRNDEAEQEYLKVLNIDRHAPVAANNLAWLYLTTNRNLDDALQLARVALLRLPNDPHVLDTVGWAYYKRNIGGEAVRYLEDSVKRAGDDPTTHYHLGMAYSLARRRQSARDELKKALSFNQPFDGIEDARRELARLGG